MKVGVKVSLGFLAGIVLVIVIPLVLLYSGVVDMSASRKPGVIESTFAPWAFEQSMERRAPKQENPLKSDPAAIANGLPHYRENCVVCHGAPDVKAAELAKGLNPSAPDLDDQDVQGVSDGELFWIIKNGIRMTGMPAFAPTRSDEEIWQIVAFVRHLPHLTPAEKDQLRASTKEKDAALHHETPPAAPANEPPGATLTPAR